MKKGYLLVILMLLLLQYDVLFAQKENNVWPMGFHAGLDFNSGSPVAYGVKRVHWEAEDIRFVDSPPA